MKRLRPYLYRLRAVGARGVIRRIPSLVKRILPKRRPRASVAAPPIPVLELIEGMADSNGCAYYDRADLRVGIITDEFMYNYYKDAVELVYLTPSNHDELLESGELDMVLYVSCWRGLAGEEWLGDTIQHYLIPRILEHARSLGIPTVFQTIEDPTNFEKFLPIAQAADVVVTSMVEKVEDYKASVGHDRVIALEYGVNPMIHNPIGINHRSQIADRYDPRTVFFAGSWMDRYAHRAADIRAIFDGVLEAGLPLLVADRNIASRMPGYTYPRRYHPYLMPAIDHRSLQKVHKLFDFNVNINTVQDSLTMCAMRTVELQALGCLMLSNYALAISHGHPGIFIINSPEEIAHIASGYGPAERYRMQVESVRAVMSSATVFDRLNVIFEQAGIATRFERPTVDVVCDTVTDAIRADFDRQSLAEKRLLTLHEWSLLTPDERGRFTAVFSDAHRYDEYYLQDLANAFKYTDSAIVTKDVEAPADEYEFFEGSTRLDLSLVKTTAVDRERLAADSIEGAGFKLDPFEVDEARRPASPEPVLSVIVPVYNNGRYLRDRCFRSLLRSSSFDRMRIILVDDGSTDGETPTIVERLARRYGNVVAHLMADGGSGSASRPRNVGASLADTPYVTYLDPDNEALNDGYTRLLEAIETHDVDLAFGSILKVSGRDPKPLGYLHGNQRISDPRALFLRERMRVSSIQALVARRSLIVENGIENPIGAIGQDSLFFSELMLNADSAYYLDVPIHLYYAERVGSAVNAISKRFFERSLILEKEQARRFEEYGVLDEYVRMRLDHFVTEWYLPKLKLVSETELDESIDLIGAIIREYGKQPSDYEALVKDVRAVHP